MKKIAVLLSLVSLILLCSCSGAGNAQITEPTTILYKEPLITNAPETEVPSVSTNSSTAPQTDSSATVSAEAHPAVPQPSSEPQPSQVSTEAQSPVSQAESTTKRELQKTGEMAFSDSADNKYINAVAQKYGAAPEKLVAIYTVPDNNGNLVLEFDGTKNEYGKLIRNENTLVAIYSVDKQLSCKRASKSSALNEYSYGEMMVMCITTTKHIMPEFEKEVQG